MILIGTMNLTRTRERGDFYCPTCSSSQTYRLRARRPFLTLYFIPTVPVGGAEVFVDCDGCRDNWDVSVLELDRAHHEAQQEDQFRDEAMRSAVLVVLADGTTSENEIATLQRIAMRLLQREADREELGHLCSVAVENKILAKNYVLTVSRRWSPEQRARALQAMFLAATADDEMGEPQMKLLSEMRDVLEMSPNEYESAIEAALSWDEV
ncbi:TerB family tellurite resistance protein [Planctomycetes bacterium K23_9]|uniref:Tellurite resistance protein TerB n=1 Tax=Stieleria marina TaxID=1930275 RepID=A0A517NU77_9BACT|nr:Tellurite resistance protein TerB [Planctomycetes bacterium K23_9]